MTDNQTTMPETPASMPDVYAAEVQPLMYQLLALGEKHKFHLIISVAFSTSETEGLAGSMISIDAQEYGSPPIQMAIAAKILSDPNPEASLQFVSVALAETIKESLARSLSDMDDQATPTTKH